MLANLAKRIFGSANDRFLKSLAKDVTAINALEPELEKLSDDELRARTPALKKRLEEGAMPPRFEVVPPPQVLNHAVGADHAPAQKRGGTNKLASSRA